MNKKLFISTIVATISGNGALITTGVNLLWLLVKSEQLFSWWIPIGLAIIFVFSMSILLSGFLKFLK